MRADFPADAPILYLPHGIARGQFRQGGGEPPMRRPRNAVSVGDMLFDARVIDTLAAALSGLDLPPVRQEGGALRAAHHTSWCMAKWPSRRSFPSSSSPISALPPTDAATGPDYLSQSSLKMIQYSYCRLPIVAPTFAAGGRDHVCAYEPGDEATIVEAFRRAQSFDRGTIETASIRGWQEAGATAFRLQGREMSGGRQRRCRHAHACE